MVLTQGSSNSFVLNSLVEEDYLHRITGFQKLCNMSEIDIELFCDTERIHIKEGLVLMEEDNGLHFNLRLPRTAVAIFYGKKVGADDLLKLSQTILEEIVKDQIDFSDTYLLQLNNNENENEYENNNEYEINELDNKNNSSNIINKKRKIDILDDIKLLKNKNNNNNINNNNKINSPIAINGKIDKASLLKLLEKHNDDNINNSIELIRSNSLTNKNDKNEMIELNELDDDEFNTEIINEEYINSSLTSFDPNNQLEYLEEGFKIIALMVRVNAAKLKDDLKKEGTRLSNWEGGTEMKHGKRELLAKLRLADNKVNKRVILTKEANIQLPRLELLSERLKLDNFEKKIILLLIGKTVSPVVRTLMDTLIDGSSNNRTGDDVISVGQALAILCEDFKMQVANRKYFYRSSRLLKNGIISLSKPRWYQGSGDLTDQRMLFDRRLLDWCVGLDSEINELVEGSDLYKPNVQLSQIVLPPGEIDIIVQQCKAYDEFCKYRIESGMNEILNYGSGLVILFCGKSGTGKTMTVNAIANELSKSVLMVDFGSLSGKKDVSVNDMDADLRGLFREAQMSNAVLFFDECESVFRNRNSGSDRILNALLTEIEKHEGIVFLATNRPYDLDEAMHRRINSVIEFKPPDCTMRKSIWNNLLGFNSKLNNNDKIKSKLNIANDVDIDAIAVKYELTGGFIKNAVVSAMLSAIGRDTKNPIICHNDIILGCKLQMRGSLTQKSIENRIIPLFGLDSIDISDAMKNALNSILEFESTRACVYGTWGPNINNNNNIIQYNTLEQRACIAAFAGPKGSGKRTLINCLAYELNRNVKLIHLSDLLNTNSISESMNNLETLLNDAKLADAIFGIDGFENILDDNNNSNGTISDNDGGISGHNVSGFKLHSVLSRMLTVLSKFTGCIILICHVDSPQNITLQRDFASSLFAFIRFITPSSDIRSRLWKRLLPNRVPTYNNNNNNNNNELENNINSINCNNNKQDKNNHTINFIELGKRYELNPGNIRNAIARACALVAARIFKYQSTTTTTNNNNNNNNIPLYLTQQDLILAGEAESKKLKGNYNESIMSLFI